MKYRTTSLSPGRVESGMKLAAAVLDKERNILLAAGAELDAVLLDRLSRRGIEAVAVQVPDLRDAATIAVELAEAEARVAQIFRGNGSAARTQLHAAMLHYRQESTK